MAILHRKFEVLNGKRAFIANFEGNLINFLQPKKGNVCKQIKSLSTMSVRLSAKALYPERAQVYNLMLV